MAIRTYTVSVDDRARAQLSELVQHLREAGLEVTQQFDAIGVIVGRADEDHLAQLRAMPGVSAIDEERSVRALPEPPRG